MSLLPDTGLLLSQLRATSGTEWAATLLGIAYILAIMRRRRWGWVAGGASSLLLTVLAVQARLPMQGLLQASYVLVAVYGWASWRRPQRERPIGWWPWRGHVLVILACTLLALGAMPLLRASGASDWPFLDAWLAALGLFASWLTARMKLENWLYWIGIDALSVYLFAVQGLVLVALLLAAYLVLACFGLAGWWRRWRLPQQEGTA